MPGPKTSAQRGKTAANLRGNNKKKRFKNDSDKQQAYKTKRALRKDKDRKRKARRAKA